VLGIVTLLLFILLINCVPAKAVPSFAIIVYDHGLAKDVAWTQNGHFVPMNKTTTFTQDDSYVYAYFTAALSTANVTWQWYEPNGDLFRERTDQERCSVAPCTFVFYFGLANSLAASKFGFWKMDLAVSGSILYSEHFFIMPIVNQENHWNFNVEQSTPFIAHGYLSVTIHPSNDTWSSYLIQMPYAENVTAYELTNKTERTLSVMTNNVTNEILVDMGAARSDGFTFVLSFDVSYGMRHLNDLNAGDFAFTWKEYLDDTHPIPQTFTITLPQESQVIDTIGFNAMVLKTNLTSVSIPSISFSTTALGRQNFGWTVIYRDYTWRNLHIKPIRVAPLLLDLPIPILPITLRDASLWSAIMSAFVLTGSELLSPLYARTGILINRRRLRIAALILVVIFLVTTGYRLLAIVLSVRNA